MAFSSVVVLAGSGAFRSRIGVLVRPVVVGLVGVALAVDTAVTNIATAVSRSTFFVCKVILILSHFSAVKGK